MSMQEILQAISTVGFPIFVAVWMLYKSSKDSETMTATINELKNAINLLTAKLEGGAKNDKNSDSN